jgi:hypothetical protein
MNDELDRVRVASTFPPHNILTTTTNTTTMMMIPSISISSQPLLPLPLSSYRGEENSNMMFHNDETEAAPAAAATPATPATVSNSSSPSTSLFMGGQPQSAPATTSSRLSMIPKRSSSSSAAIPITGCMRRTSSETQLHTQTEDEMHAEADYKDYMIYSRIVNGISRQMDNSTRGGSLPSPESSLWKYQNQQCLENIVRARHDIKPGQVLPGGQQQQHYYYYTTQTHGGHPNNHQHQRLVHYVSDALDVSTESLVEDDVDDDAIFDLEL